MMTRQRLNVTHLFQIVLPYLECEKVKDRHCMVVPRAGKGYKYQIDK